MMLYSSRHNLGKMFDKWAKKEHALNCSENVVTWLHMNGLIDEYKAKKFLEKHCPPRNDKGRFIKYAHLNYTGIILPQKK